MMLNLHVNVEAFYFFFLFCKQIVTFRFISNLFETKNFFLELLGMGSLFRFNLLETSFLKEVKVKPNINVFHDTGKPC